MKAEVEYYKGIDFIRISTLPEDQKKMIWESQPAGKIIKILRDKELLNDCLRYSDYIAWYQENYKPTQPSSGQPVLRAKELKLAFR